jgi:hypothetical protein
MHEAADFFFFVGQKSQVLAAVNDFVALAEILDGEGLCGVAAQVVRPLHHAAIALRAGAEPLSQGFARAVHVIVQAAAGSAGLAGIRLAQNSDL